MEQINLGMMLIQAGHANSRSMGQSNKGITPHIETFDKTFTYVKKNIEVESSTRNYQKVNGNMKALYKRESQEVDTVDTKKSSYVKNEEPIVKNNAINDSKEILEESNTNQEDEQILSLISQVLHIPIEEIKMLLSQLGLAAQDLMNQEKFSIFISEALGKGNMEMLLTENSNLSMVTQLFEELTKLNNTTNMNQIVMHEAVTTQTSDLQQHTDRVVEENTLEMIQNNEEIDVIGRNNIYIIKDDKKTNLNREIEKNLSFLHTNEMSTEAIGEQIPVHHFTSTQLVQGFEGTEGIVVQTITTKANVSGEAFIEQIDFKTIGQTKELNVQLSPKELGQLNIKIVEHNGTLVAEIKVDNEKVKNSILSEIHLLKENLEGEGLNISDVKVDIRQGQHQSQMEQERQKSSKRIQEIISKHFNQLDVEENEDLNSIVTESEVDYMV